MVKLNPLLCETPLIRTYWTGPQKLEIRVLLYKNELAGSEYFNVNAVSPDQSFWFIFKRLIKGGDRGAAGPSPGWLGSGYRGDVSSSPRETDQGRQTGGGGGGGAEHSPPMGALDGGLPMSHVDFKGNQQAA